MACRRIGLLAVLVLCGAVRQYFGGTVARHRATGLPAEGSSAWTLTHSTLRGFPGGLMIYASDLFKVVGSLKVGLQPADAGFTETRGI